MLHSSLGSPEISASPPRNVRCFLCLVPGFQGPWSRCLCWKWRCTATHGSCPPWVCAPTRPPARCQLLRGRYVTHVAGLGLFPVQPECSQQQPQAVTLQHRIRLQGCSQGISPQLSRLPGPMVVLAGGDGVAKAKKRPWLLFRESFHTSPDTGKPTLESTHWRDWSLMYTWNVQTQHFRAISYCSLHTRAPTMLDHELLMDVVPSQKGPWRLNPVLPSLFCSRSP